MKVLNALKSILEKIVKFLSESKIEAKKVIWPSRRYVVTATIIVIVVVMILSVFLMFVDASLAWVFTVLDKII